MFKKNNKNKTVFISGSSSGIGFGIAKIFAEHGYKVGLNGVNKLRLIKAQNLISNSKIFNYDLIEQKNIQILKKEIKKEFKKIDILICNLGNSNFDKNHENISGAFKNNFFPTVNLISTLSDLIKSNGRIICISSICGLEHVHGAPYGYSIAKSALHTYVKCFSNIYAKKNITLNAVAPGNIIFKGSTWKKKLNQDKVKTVDFIKKNVPLKRFGKPDEVARLCLYLCSKEASFINGSIIPIDGGQTKKF